ncbi:hypothetical protein [Noviherbaspirillum cavernae]|uniref:hypothetical protein n=1 Tax=Noviherbaspirillum cavernae TaxID=2320862 RepID=UPI0011C446EC|nr:hypothetical protein [Noviherbaspirillum cavernae]
MAPSGSGNLPMFRCDAVLATVRCRVDGASHDLHEHAHAEAPLTEHEDWQFFKAVLDGQGFADQDHAVRLSDLTRRMRRRNDKGMTGVNPESVMDLSALR